MNHMPEPHAPVRIGFTEAHGMADEASRFPPPGVVYSFLRPAAVQPLRLIRSPIKGYLRRFETAGHDLIEAVLSPILTKNRWIYSIENLQAATAFSFLGLPIPRAVRVAYLVNLLLKDNLKKAIFWSFAGRETLLTYGNVRDEKLLEKVDVVYPAVRTVPDELIRYNNKTSKILFSGDFFRKGGVNVVDAFERAQRHYPKINLRLCCDPGIDFNTPNERLRSEYLKRIGRNGSILLGRVSREEMINRILPETDIYVLPTYAETFGFAILEAMAFGIPVISTTHFAIPELIGDGESGYLVDTQQFDCERMFRGYVVDHIPDDFRQQVTEGVYKSLCALIESVELRERMGRHGCSVARTKFSFETRNEKMLAIYHAALRD